MNVFLTSRGTRKEITKYVNPLSVSITETIDETLDSATLVLNPVRFDTLDVKWLDMSRPIPNYSRVEIMEGTETYVFCVMEDKMRMQRDFQDHSLRLWEHRLHLIELTKEFQRVNVPDNTVTQAKGNLGAFYFSDNSLTDRETIPNPEGGFRKDESSPQDGITFHNNIGAVPFRNTHNYGDTSIVEGFTMKKDDREYRIVGSFTVANFQGANNPIPNIRIADIEITMFVNGVAKTTIVETIPGGTLNSGFFYRTVTATLRVVPFTFDIQPTEISLIEFRARTIGGYQSGNLYFENRLSITDAFISVTSISSDNAGQIMVDEEIDKLLDIHHLSKTTDTTRKYSLSPVTRQKLVARNLTCPEFTFNSRNLYDCLLSIAKYVGAIPYLTPDNQVEFMFYEDFDSFPVIDAPNIKTIEARRNMEDYVGGVELNVDNLISQSKDDGLKHYPFNNEWGTLRTDSDGTAEIETSNLGIHLDEGIDTIHQVLVKGFAFSIRLSNPEGDVDINITPNQSIDITSQIKEKTVYDALDNASTYELNERKSGRTKNNNLYYTRGDNKILGLSFSGTREPVWVGGTESIRALYETTVSAIVQQNILDVLEVYGGFRDIDPGTIENDNQIQFKVIYKPFTVSRTTIYKDDLSGFETPLVRYLNENERVNDMRSLGETAQLTVNRMGTTIWNVSGFAPSIESIPKTGTKDSEGRVCVTRSFNVGYKEKGYTLQYVKDYAALSTYVGIKSDIRMYEIPNDNIVQRIDKYQEFVSFSDVPFEEVSDSEFIDNLSLIVGVFEETDSFKYNIALITTHNQAGDAIESVISPITTKAEGRTLSFQWRAKDNRSFGVLKEKAEETDTYWQRSVGYVDVLGQVNNVKVEIYETGNGTDVISQMDNYPLYDNNNIFEKVFDLNYVCKKDARERLGFAAEVTFFGKENITIYNSIARSHHLYKASGSTKWVVFVNDYYPSKNAIFVEFSRTVDTTTYNFTQEPSKLIIDLLVPMGDYNGIGLINESGELIMTIKKDFHHEGGNLIQDIYFIKKRV